MANIRFTDPGILVQAAGSTSDSTISLTNATVDSNVITFTKSDNSQFSITVETGSAGGFFDSGSLLTTASLAR